MPNKLSRKEVKFAKLLKFSLNKTYYHQFWYRTYFFFSENVNNNNKTICVPSTPHLKSYSTYLCSSRYSNRLLTVAQRLINNNNKNREEKSMFSGHDQSWSEAQSRPASCTPFSNLTEPPKQEWVGKDVAFYPEQSSKPIYWRLSKDVIISANCYRPPHCRQPLTKKGGKYQRNRAW